MGGEIAVAEVEPGLAAEAIECGHKGPGLLAPAPPQLRFVEAGEGIEQRIDIRRDREPEMLEIVAGIGDDGQRSGRQDAIEPECELGAADPARQREHAHRKRSCSAGRTKAAAGTSGADQVRPRTSTIGIASSACPIKSPAAAAISSAKPVSVTSNSRPKRSGWPRRSTNAGSPAAPSATPTVPLRQGRPKLSLMMTPSPTPKTLIRYCRKAWAEPSGSTGRSSTRSEPSSAATFEWSMPALAITKPRRCSTISRPGRWRTT